MIAGESFGDTTNSDPSCSLQTQPWQQMKQISDTSCSRMFDGEIALALCYTVSVCVCVSLSVLGQGLGSEHTSKAATAQGGNITSPGAHHWQTVDTRTIYYPRGQTRAANILPITPQLPLSDPFLFAPLLSGYKLRLACAFVRGCAWA